MHNAALAELGLAAEWSYEAIEVAPEEFEPLVRGMPAEGFVGANVTVPHKVAALAAGRRGLRGGAGDRRRQHAQLLRRADRRREHGRLGLLGLRSRQPPTGKRALVLGAGGSARAVRLGAGHGRAPR